MLQRPGPDEFAPFYQGYVDTFLFNRFFVVFDLFHPLSRLPENYQISNTPSSKGSADDSRAEGAASHIWINF